MESACMSNYSHTYPPSRWPGSLINPMKASIWWITHWMQLLWTSSSSIQLWDWRLTGSKTLWALHECRKGNLLRHMYILMNTFFLPMIIVKHYLYYLFGQWDRVRFHYLQDSGLVSGISLSKGMLSARVTFMLYVSSGGRTGLTNIVDWSSWSFLVLYWSTTFSLFSWIGSSLK